jgi:hypothetical protein
MHLHTLWANISEAIATKTRLEIPQGTEHIIINAYLVDGRVKPIAELKYVKINIIEVICVSETICKSCLGKKMPDEPICQKCKTKLKKRFKNASTPNLPRKPAM